jgi:hypothetical protein
MGGTGTTGAGATIARARGAIIGAPDCDREHLIPDPKPPLPPWVHDAHPRGARRARHGRLGARPFGGAGLVLVGSVLVSLAQLSQLAL